MGETIAYQTSINTATSNQRMSAEVLKVVGEFVKNTVNKVQTFVRELLRVELIFVLRNID